MKEELKNIKRDRLDEILIELYVAIGAAMEDRLLGQKGAIVFQEEEETILMLDRMTMTLLLSVREEGILSYLSSMGYALPERVLTESMRVPSGILQVYRDYLQDLEGEVEPSQRLDVVLLFLEALISANPILQERLGRVWREGERAPLCSVGTDTSILSRYGYIEPIGVNAYIAEEEV